jgi:hypothetical protein
MPAAFEPTVPASEADEFIGLPLLPPLMAAEEFIALTPGPLGTSEPAGPGTELPTGPELPVPLLLPLEPAPAAASDAPAPAPWARAFVESVAIASESVAPNMIVVRVLFIVTTPSRK